MLHVDKEPDNVLVTDGVPLVDIVEHTLTLTDTVGLVVAPREPDALPVVVSDALTDCALSMDVTPEDDGECVFDTDEHALADSVGDMLGDRLSDTVGELVLEARADADAHLVVDGLPE